MPSLSFETIGSADVAVFVIMLLIYGFFTFVPMIAGIVLAYRIPGDTAAEKAFDTKWYKWKKQYIYLEVWFRFHCIWDGSLIVIWINEFSEWPVAIAIPGIIFFILVAIGLKVASKLVEERIPSEIMKKELYSFITASITLRSNSAANGLTGDMADFRIENEFMKKQSDLNVISETGDDLSMSMGEDEEASTVAQETMDNTKKNSIHGDAGVKHFVTVTAAQTYTATASVSPPPSKATESQKEPNANADTDTDTDTNTNYNTDNNNNTKSADTADTADTNGNDNKSSGEAQAEAQAEAPKDDDDIQQGTYTD